MIGLIIAFIVGVLVTRIFLARVNTKRVDWMRSSEWSSNKYYQRLHDYICELCPKRHYCERYKNDT